MKQVTVYGRPGCGLCREVESIISRVALRQRFHLQRKNVLENAADRERYGTAVPVVLVDGREIARCRLTQYELEAALGV